LCPFQVMSVSNFQFLYQLYYHWKWKQGTNPYFLRYLKDGGIHHILPLTKVQFLYACRVFSSHSVLLFKFLFEVLIHDTTQLLNMDGCGACSMGWGRETESLLAIFIFTGRGLKSSLNKTFWCHTHT
jgi:hypothetical protein